MIDSDLYEGLIRIHILHHAISKAGFRWWFIDELARHGYNLSPGMLYPILPWIRAQGLFTLVVTTLGKSSRREHTQSSGKIRHETNPTAYSKAKEWLTIVKNLREQAGTFLKTHPSEDLKTALQALAIAEGSLEEVA